MVSTGKNTAKPLYLPPNTTEVDVRKRNRGADSSSSDLNLFAHVVIFFRKGRMHMDSNHSWWNNTRSRRTFLFINLVLIILAFSVYLINQLVVKRACKNVLIHGYVNDTLAVVLLLSYSNILISLSKQDGFLIHSLTRISCFTTFVGFFWEYVTPLYKTNSVKDPWDLVAYTLGGLSYYACITLWQWRIYYLSSYSTETHRTKTGLN